MLKRVTFQKFFGRDGHIVRFIYKLHKKQNTNNMACSPTTTANAVKISNLIRRTKRTRKNQNMVSHTDRVFAGGIIWTKIDHIALSNVARMNVCSGEDY